VAGQVDRDGVKIHYEVYGDGETTILFAPLDTIVDGRVWKGQVPYLSRHFRIITVDPRGNGQSDRPTEPSAYDDVVIVVDAIAVLDELGVEKAVLVSICFTAWLALLAAYLHPDRVLGVVAIAPFCLDEGGAIEHRRDPHARFDEELASYDGWYRINRHYWSTGWSEFTEFFFGELCNEPHSSKIMEDAVGYAAGTDAEVMLAVHDSEFYAKTPAETEKVLRGVACPVLVIEGTQDRCQPRARFDLVARLTGAERLVLEGVGHLPMAREPVAVNKAIRSFVDRLVGTPPPRVRHWTRGASRRPRVLYLSSPIGLGHARRDLAIAQAMRELRPDLELQWLTQSPVAEFLEKQGEVVHPASRFLASESGHFESESGEHDLHAFAAVRRMDELLVNNFMVFDDLVERERFDLWVGDEAWDLDHFLHENPELKRAPFVWMTDFVGWMPMPDADERERWLTADWNAEMVEHVARFPALRDRSVFVGDPADVVDVPLGPGLPSARAWTEEHFDFAGYVMGEQPQPSDRPTLRKRLGYAESDVVCVVSVGGSGVGGHLLRKVVAAYPEARRRVPGLRMVAVAGPRIDPASLDAPPGVEVHGFLPDLDLHHAACDVAVVQGGLSTTMELTAAGRPFLYFPLGHHFEQQVHVRHRLERHGAGRAMDYLSADPVSIAEALVEQLARPTAYLPVPPGGAQRAAQLVAELI
jgi:pimeloyl-ACP methyl ester carboxylesterase/predicted glycosyltransferase